MPKTFYTEHDIEDLAKRGVISLVVDDDIVLTDLAREKALRLRIELQREAPPCAPERPYLAKLASPSASQPAPKRALPPQTSAPPKKVDDAIYQRVYDAALARLGNSIDPKLLETIIRRVLQTVTSK